MRGEEALQPPEEVLSRFPLLAEVIRRTYAADEPFRELCGDHAECVRIIERVRRVDGGLDQRFEQYLELRIHLEDELLSRIGGPTAPPPSFAKHPIKP
jgi:hypothetical protein